MRVFVGSWHNRLAPMGGVTTSCTLVIGVRPSVDVRVKHCHIAYMHLGALVTHTGIEPMIPP